MIEKYHDTAKQNGVRIVPMCGFDSIPADLGTLMIINEFKRLKKPCASIRAFVTGYGGMRYVQRRITRVMHHRSSRLA
jgi:short subunit dehydrogenase-like uncharacterized protein